MNKGYEHTPDNQVNIHIKLCVHPIIISKGIKTWIKRSLRVVTWLGYKRKDICGIVEFKWPSIEEHSFYIHTKCKFTTFLLNSKQTLRDKQSTPWSWQLILFWFFFLFFFFSFSFLFFFMYTFCSSFYFWVFITMSWSTIQFHHFLTIKLTSLFSPTWIQT